MSNPLSSLGKGTYVLILNLKRDKRVIVGNSKKAELSPRLFQAGYYAYVGSAFGPGGLSSRIKRHLVKDKALIWNIDFLRKESGPVEVWVSDQKNRPEKQWAKILSDMNRGEPIENFGNTDDVKSKTHLFYFKKQPSVRIFRELIKKKIPNHEPIRKISIFRFS